MVLYELRNINGNFMPHFFGIIFPNLMCVLLSKTVGSQVPDQMRQEVVTSIMLTMTLVIPMAIMLIGYGALYAQEVERGIPLRMRLFGVGSLYLIGIIFLIIAHALANIFRKFSLTFGVTMFLYFGMMILTGMMGMRTDQLPEFLQKVAAALPMTYVSNDFIGFWQGGKYNFMPFIQSFIFMGAAAGILLMCSFHFQQRSQTRGKDSIFA